MYLQGLLQINAIQYDIKSKYQISYENAIQLNELQVSNYDHLTVLKTGRNIVVVPVLMEGVTAVIGAFLTIEIFCVGPDVE